jgi:hypothetical protein
VQVISWIGLFFLIDYGGSLRGSLARIVAWTLCVGGIFALEAQIFAALSGLRSRYVLACIRADLSPRDHAAALGMHLMLSKKIANDDALEVAFRIGRLAHLRTTPS